MNRFFSFIHKNYRYISLGLLTLFLLLFFIPYNFDVPPYGFSEKRINHSLFPYFIDIIKYFKIQNFSFWFKYCLFPVFSYFLGLILIILDVLFSWKKSKISSLLGFCSFLILFIGLCIGSFPGFTHYLHIGFYIPLIVIILYLVYYFLSIINFAKKKLKYTSKKDRIAQLEREVAELKASKKDE